MSIGIERCNVLYCSICDEVSNQKTEWNKEQESLMNEGKISEKQEFEGVPGVAIYSDGNRYSSTRICDKCLKSIKYCSKLLDRNPLVSHIEVDMEFEKDS